MEFRFHVKNGNNGSDTNVFFFLSSGEHVAQFKFTVLLMPNGPHKITGLPFEEELYSSEHSVKDADIQVSTFA